MNVNNAQSAELNASLIIAVYKDMDALDAILKAFKN